MSIDIEILKKLAGVKEEKDDLSDLLGMSEVGEASELRQALAEISANERATLMRVSAVEIKELIKRSQAYRASEVKEIREARARLKKQIASVEATQAAEEYGLQTMNFIPLAHAMGETTWSAEAEIPAKWMEKWKADKVKKNTEQAATRKNACAAHKTVTK